MLPKLKLATAAISVPNYMRLAYVLSEIFNNLALCKPEFDRSRDKRFQSKSFHKIISAMATHVKRPARIAKIAKTGFLDLFKK